MVNVNVRLGCEADLDTIVAIHMRAFPGSFLTRLGHPFLSEMYQWFLKRAEGRLLVAEVDGTIAGFVAGALCPESFFRKLLLTRWFAFAWASAGAALRQPQTVIPRLLSALQYRGERPPRMIRAALLSSIAVEPHASGLGIGTSLITAYCEEASQRGLRYVYLTTDRDANESANNFYLRHGFIVESEIRRYSGRFMIRYVRPLGESQA